VFAKTKNAHEVACFMYSAIGEKLCKEDQDKVHLKNLLESIDEFVKSNPDDPSLLNYINKTPLIAGENLDEYNDYVSLMTVHSAKGLEFKYVFIVGMEEKIFPSESALLAGELEDERRLFYVAMTRAKEKLFISYVTNRVLFGSAIISTKSRFLDEINPEFVEVSLPKKKSTGISIGRLYKTSFQDVKKCNGLHLESKVYHPMYNKYGKIKNFREVEGRIMVDIEFEDEQTVSIAENVLTLFNS
jgi:ATP-dependent helicase/DNAse subunit B